MNINQNRGFTHPRNHGCLGKPFQPIKKGFRVTLFDHQNWGCNKNWVVNGALVEPYLQPMMAIITPIWG
jgi:hypothetical protein